VYASLDCGGTSIRPIDRAAMEMADDQPGGYLLCGDCGEVWRDAD
jgi:hypothetical protein